MGEHRALGMCRSWLFLAGNDGEGLRAGPTSGADVLIQELEDSVPRDQRDAARARTADVLPAWRAAGALTAVRVNPLAAGGLEDLDAVVPARPDVVMLAKCETPEQVAELEREVARREAATGADRPLLLVPNVESAAGLIRTHAIATASPRVAACLLASEDLAHDLGGDRSRDGLELAYARARFHVECAAAGVVSIDCPYTFGDEDGLRAETGYARRLGYTAKSAVAASHATVINELLTPSPAAVWEAREVVRAFEQPGAPPGAREPGGRLVERPTYLAARRTLHRAEGLDGAR